ncbi:cephalosporin hydroxylase family protein [Nitrosopumilus sp.]|nr:cephalosporin hydroxylase family protein [Nitrosopumilus sp.]
MNENEKFENHNKKIIKQMNKDVGFLNLSKKWLLQSLKHQYSYHFTWLGLPIIQYPQDIIATQEIIWNVKPDLIIETGIARGGSLIFSASILQMIGKGSVLGIDIDIRKHNKIAIKKHHLSKRITMIEGSSIDEKVVNKVKTIAKTKKRVMVFLDSNHTYEHVLKELELYSSLVKKGSYIIVFDTIIDDIPNNWWGKHISTRPWNKKNNPKSAVKDFVLKNNRFKIDHTIDNKILLTVAPSGFLKCTKN